MNKRSYLKRKEKILLCGESDRGTFLRTFSIESIINASDGASTICYTAKHDKSGIGVLKEFYPFSVHSLVRNDAGQLIQNSDMVEENEKFARLLKAYIEPYDILLEIRRQGDLATFIPPFEIYYGCDEDGNCIGTIYIWSPEPTLETFDHVCEEIHEHPTVNPELNLVRILYAIESLVKCTCVLHNTGLIHRDIKPSNFGFVKRGQELLTQTISFFDIDTICSVYHVPKDFTKISNGFAEPELSNRKANNLTDIFAIGACLFHAIIVHDDVKKENYLYHPAFYPNLKKLVDESELIQASEVNAHPHLRAVLTKILQKTLCGRDERYQSCEELLADVQKALYYVIPANIADRGNAGEQWILADVEQLHLLDANKDKNATLALQYHLYTAPLYQHCSKEKDTLDVLIVGFGEYGQKFLDLALQIAQIPGKHLCITIISDSPEDKAIYLAKRPELSQFFNIDHSLSEDAESYGEIRFVEYAFLCDDADKNLCFLQELFSSDTPDYAFVATGRDSRNLFIAKSIEPFCRTYLTWEGKHISKKERASLYPIYIHEDIRTYPFFSELERMAFNVHLIWNKNLNIPFGEVRAEFRKPYNHNSCVSFVLAMKYKLYSIGICMDSGTTTELAKLYFDFIHTHPDQKDILVYFEHRRWVTEKLCLGYTRITNLDACANGKTKDERQKRHVCIVRSTPKNTLSSSDWMISSNQINQKKWDKPTKKDLQTLDDLDRMSVELHLVYLKHAKMEMKNNIFNGEIVTAITNQIERDVTCVVTFQELLTCMKEIRNNDSEQWKRYEGLRHLFMDSIKQSNILSERDQKAIRKLMDSLHEKFYPILASQQYRDYKKDDVALVEGIPFILTYSDSLYLVIPYVTGNNTQLFANLAAPTVINPAKILYVAYCNSMSDLKKIEEDLPYLSNYMKKKKIRAHVEWIIGVNPSMEIETANIASSFQERSENRISRVKWVVADSRRTYVKSINAYFKRRQKGNCHLLLESNETTLSGVMEGLGLFEAFSSYRYDSIKMKFDVIHDCEIVNYIRVHPFITVTDMFAFKMSTSTTSNQPEFFNDYKDLWSKYRMFTSVWKFLCRICREYSDRNDVVASFKRNNNDYGSEEEYTYIIPFKCKQVVTKIIQALQSEEIIGNQSHISSLTTHSCMVVIQDLYRNKKIFDILFYRMDILLQPDFVQCIVDTKSHVVKVLYNNLMVHQLDCKTLQDGGYELLDYFHSKNYIIHLSYDKAAKKASFTYATPQIKDLLTTEGRMLEIYTYHNAKETGAFDDIRSSFEIDWENSIASNEFDCILTKGFSALFVECKATKSIESGFYTKLSRLAELFGINAKAVLIADTQDNLDYKPINDRQKEHGEKMDVITISDRTDIDHIGTKLLSLL